MCVVCRGVGRKAKSEDGSRCGAIRFSNFAASRIGMDRVPAAHIVLVASWPPPSSTDRTGHTAHCNTSRHRSETMVKVAVKWNKRVFDDVEVTPTVADFKAKLQELTVRNWFGTSAGTTATTTAVLAVSLVVSSSISPLLGD